MAEDEPYLGFSADDIPEDLQNEEQLLELDVKSQNYVDSTNVEIENNTQVISADQHDSFAQLANSGITTEYLVRLQQIQQTISFAINLGFVPIALNGKRPVLNNWQKIQKEDALEKIIEGITQYGADNIGIRCGKVSGIVVVDIDAKNNGLSTWNTLIAMYNDPYTFKVKTGSGGYHYYFKYDSDNEMLKSRSGAIKYNGATVAIDIKTNGGQVVFVGSIHPETKQQYQWVNNNPNGEKNMPPINKMPTWLLALLLETEKINTLTTVSSPQHQKPQLISMVNNSNVSLTSTSNPESPPIISEATLKAMLDKFSVDRASNYDDWIKVVWAIKAISPDYYHLAKYFSLKTNRNNFDEKALQKAWNEGNGKIKLGSLLYWLKWDVDEEKYTDFLKDHGLLTWSPIPCEASNESINFHGNKVTWHVLIKKYHEQSVWDVRSVVKDMMQCVALVVGADEVFFIKERYDEYGALQYNLAKSSKFTSIARKYHFMECKKINDKLIKRITWNFSELLNTYMTQLPYNHIDFSPAGNEPNVVNTFTGLRAKRVEYNVTDIVDILIHIKEVLCSDDSSCYEYFLNKLAYFFQNLGIKKLGVADVIISPQGIGKNIFYEHLGRYVLGEQYWYITSDINKLTGRFNKNMMGKLLIIGDEAKGHGKTAELIKPLITQEVQWVEPKGSEQFKISDWAMYAFFANSATYFEVEDGDRRYFVLRGNEKYKGNKAYFDNFSKKFQQFGDAFYSFLMDRDISAFNIQHIPCTPIKIMLQSAAGPSCRVFIKTWDWILLKPDPHNLMKYAEDGQILEGQSVSLGQLYGQYEIWCKRNGISKIESKIQFGKDLADLFEIDRKNMKSMRRPKSPPSILDL